MNDTRRWQRRALALPIGDDQVDFVFANGLIEHLTDPGIALAEFARVLKPDALIAVRSRDWGTVMLEPRSVRLQLSIDLRNRWHRHSGGDPEAGRKLRALLAASGFLLIDGHVEADSGDDPRAMCEYMQRVLRDPALRERCEQQACASAAELEKMIAAWSRWSSSADAFVATLWCYAIARAGAGALSQDTS